MSHDGKSHGMNAEAETNQCRGGTRLTPVRFLFFRRLDGGFSQPRISIRGSYTVASCPVAHITTRFTRRSSRVIWAMLPLLNSK